MHIVYYIKRARWSGALVLLLLLVQVGCDSKQPSEPATEETSKAVTDAKEEVAEVGSAVNEDSSKMVEDFQKNIEVKLSELDQQEEALTQKAAQVEADAKAEYHETLTTLQEEKQALRQRFSEMTSAAIDKTDTVQTEIENAILQLEEKYRNALDQFST